MAILGAKQKVLFNGVDLSTFFNNKDSTQQVKEHDTTTFGATAETHAVGLRSAKVTLAGIFDSAAPATSPDPVLAAKVGSSTDANVLMAENGFALGNRVEILQASVATYKPMAPVNGIVTFNVDLTADAGLDPGVSLQDLTAATVTGVSTAVDNGAATYGGGVGMAQCTAGSGASSPTDTRVIGHSTDNVTFAPLITFAAFTLSTTVTAQRIVVNPAGVAASGTVTIGGTFHAGDIVTVSLGANNLYLPGFTYTVLAGDTNLNGIAASLATALNLVATFAASFTASASSAIVTIAANKAGSSGNVALSSGVTGGGATVTATASGAALTGGRAIGPINRYVRNQQTITGGGPSFTTAVGFARYVDQGT